MQPLHSWAEVLADQPRATSDPLKLLLQTCQVRRSSPLGPEDPLFTPKAQAAAFQQGLKNPWPDSQTNGQTFTSSHEIQDLLSPHLRVQMQCIHVM